MARQNIRKVPINPMRKHSLSSVIKATAPIKKKLAFKSMKQVKAHIAKSGTEKSESKAHEARESKGFERAEHRVKGY